MRRKCVLLVALMLAATVPLFAQISESSDQPLGDVARSNRSVKKTKDPSTTATRIVNDDDGTALRKVPIPAIALDGPDNVQEILDAIHEYRSKHKPNETEDAVHYWFDEQNQVLSAAIDNLARMQHFNQMKMENAQDRASYPYNPNHDFDPSKYNDYLTGQRWSQRVDMRSAQENQVIIFRIQQAFLKVRVDVICRPNKIQPAAYDWFKIRAANGMSSY